MLVILAIVAYYVGQIATVTCLIASTLVSVIGRHPVALLPAGLAVLWTLGTVDFVDQLDGPMRIDENLNLLGTGREGPLPLANDDGSGPVWWIPALSAACFALLTLWPKIPNLRTVARIGLACIATAYAGLAGLHVMY